MSVFDQFGDRYLPGDRQNRKINLDADIYEDFNDEEELLSNRPQISFTIFYVACILVFGLLVLKLLNLQIAQGGLNRVLAEGNRLRVRQIPAPRGIIYDRKNTNLLNNEAAYSLQVYPLELPKNSAERNNYYEKLSEIVQIPPAEIKSIIEKRGVYLSDPVVLKDNLDRAAALVLEVKTINFPGVLVAKQPIRDYKDIGGLSQVIGYVGKLTDTDLKNYPNYRLNEEIGKDGLEKIYQEYLKGTPGLDQIEVDSRGQAQRLLSSNAPSPGNNLVLNLDADLQKTIADSLKNQLDKTAAKAASAVAIDPQTGGVLAIVNLPSFDNNIFSHGISADDYAKLLNDKTYPMFNRAISGNYPSGSTLKPLVAAAALQEKTVTKNTTVVTPPAIKIGSYTFPDWKDHSYESTNIERAIAESNDIFFYALGGGWDKIKGIGPDKIKYYLQKFGLGAITGIDLPGEAKGLVPDPSWKEKVKKEMWYLGDTYHMAIGQGDILVTPLQMAVSTAAVANGGTVLSPRLVDKITDKDGNLIKTIPKQAIRTNTADAANLQIVREGMRMTVTDGTAQQLKDLNVNVAAKTGTAQYGNEGKTHAWLTAFAPYENPQIVIAVIIEGGGESTVATPVVKDAFEEFFGKKE